MKILFLILKGIVVGGANVVPGVSGATLAVILRIYDRLIESINNLFSNMKESLKFIIPVGIGMIIGILAVGEGIGLLLKHFSMPAGGFIAGLMAGSLPFIHSLAVSQKKEDSKKYYLIATIAALLIISLTFIPETGGETEITEVTFSLGFCAHLFIGGVFAAATMVIPGISGAMVLILFGLYPVALHAISLIRQYLTSPLDFEIFWQIVIIIAPLGIGIVAGILLGSKLIATLLKKFHTATYFAILGLIFGTIFLIFRDDATYQSHETITPIIIFITIITFICGALTSLRLGKQK